jgi:hypothetical protein
MKSYVQLLFLYTLRYSYAVKKTAKNEIEKVSFCIQNIAIYYIIYIQSNLNKNSTIRLLTHLLQKKYFFIFELHLHKLNTILLKLLLNLNDFK